MIGLLLAWMGFEFGPFAKPKPQVEAPPLEPARRPVGWYSFVHKLPHDQKHLAAELYAKQVKRD